MPDLALPDSLLARLVAVGLSDTEIVQALLEDHRIVVSPQVIAAWRERNQPDTGRPMLRAVR